MSLGHRQSSRNCILVKDDVGKAKPTVYDLPAETHAFGRSEPPDVEGAREVTMNWAAHVPKPKPGPQGQDFKLINKMASRNKVATAKDLADFRRTNDYPLIPPGPAGVMPKLIPSDVIPSFAYGRKSRPSTPISSVVGGHYAAEHEQTMDQVYRQYAEQAPPGATKIKLTKCAVARINEAKTRKVKELTDDMREPFKMKKFQKVPSRLSLAPQKSASTPNLHSQAQRSGSPAGSDGYKYVSDHHMHKLGGSATHLRAGGRDDDY